MKNIIDDYNYKEGTHAAKGTIKFIENTVYGSLGAAVTVKTKLVEHFTKNFGFKREIKDNEVFDRNYAYNIGMLDTYIEAHKEEQNGETN